MAGDQHVSYCHAITQAVADGHLDQLTVGIRHQAAHSDELTHLRDAATCTTRGHHVYRIRGVVLPKVPDGLVFDFLAGLRPLTGHLQELLHDCDVPVLVQCFCLVGPLPGGVTNLGLGLRHAEILDAERHTRSRGPFKAQLLQIVEKLHRGLHAMAGERPGYGLLEFLLANHLVKGRWQLTKRPKMQPTETATTKRTPSPSSCEKREAGTTGSACWWCPCWAAVLR
mmetsp:Transcript_141235/g.393622  ORF Transcript_141235/g.393622 Transcript_141235/m.393622 type:complete len:226 (+) Transcript_141235:534-1211(+)